MCEIQKKIKTHKNLQYLQQASMHLTPANDDEGEIFSQIELGTDSEEDSKPTSVIEKKSVSTSAKSTDNSTNFTSANSLHRQDTGNLKPNNKNITTESNKKTDSQSPTVNHPINYADRANNDTIVEWSALVNHIKEKTFNALRICTFDLYK